MMIEESTISDELIRRRPTRLPQSGFVIRHWKTRPRPATAGPRYGSFHLIFLLVMLAGLLLGGCLGRRLTKANVDQVEKGMSRKQVESILGPPTSIDSTDLLVTKKVTYVYQQGNESVTVVFFSDAVSSKESNLHD